MSENAPPEELEQTSSVPAGVLLREARLATKLSIEEVASELHLSADIVDALEKGDKERLPSRVFTLGYLKNYAKLVNVSFEEARAAFDDMAEEEIPVLNQPRAPSISAQSRKSSGGTGGWLLKSFLWFVVLGLLLIAFLWWKGDVKIPGLGNDFPFRTGTAPADESPQTHPVEATGGQPAALSVTLDPETNQQLLVPLQSGDEAPAAVAEEIVTTDTGQPPGLAEPVVQESMPPADETESAVSVSEPSTETDEQATQIESPTVELPVVEPLSEEEPVSREAIEIPVVVQQESLSSPLSTLASIMPAVEEAPESAPAPGESDEAVAAADQSGIQIDFSGRCWVQVTDGNGKVILSGEMQAGDSKEIDGASPLRFVLGNAKVVRLTVGNEQFDLDPHTSGNVARFTLEATEG